MREKVRRSFVTDLAGFRHLFIRQPGGFVIRATGPDLAYDIVPIRYFDAGENTQHRTHHYGLSFPAFTRSGVRIRRNLCIREGVRIRTRCVYVLPLA